MRRAADLPAALRERLRSYPDLDVVPLVADVTDESRIAMLEMGDPVRIVGLAENLIRLPGIEPHCDVAIGFTGLLPGETLHEELMRGVEHTVSTPVEKVSVVQPDETDTARL